MASPSGAVPISELESVAHAAQRLGLSPSYLYRLIRLGKLPAWEVAQKLVVRMADVDLLRKAS